MPWLPALALASLAVPLVLLRLRVGLRRVGRRTRTLAFLHPYCNDGGGGERVLWAAIRSLVSHPLFENRGWRIVVYTGDEASDAQIRHLAAARFGIEVPSCVHFVRLSLRAMTEAKYYPVATLVGQAVGSVLLAAEAVCRAPPDVLVDTTGLGFSFPLLRLVGVHRLAAYVHYPIISSDMLDAVRSRRVAHNNKGSIARSAVGTALKVAYYHLLAALYSLAGRCVTLTIANGSWTAGHLSKLWGREPAIIFPPCNTQALQALPLHPPGGRRAQVLSLAQFRPEKNHALQLRAFAQLLARYDATAEPRPPRPRLVVAGAVRHEDDEALLAALRQTSHSLALQPDDVTFVTNLPIDAVQQLLASSAVGLHTMWNEHFGIGVVEMMAAGLAVVAHDSGGPAMDIIGRNKETGLLASSEEEYCDAMAELLLLPDSEQRRAVIAAAARNSVRSRFSETAFAHAFVAQMSSLIN